jgi:hypothetical protein
MLVRRKSGIILKYYSIHLILHVILDMGTRSKEKIKKKVGA